MGLTRRNFLRAILPAAIGAPILLDEILHPGRVFFLPTPAAAAEVPLAPGFETTFIPNLWSEAIVDAFRRDLERTIMKTAFVNRMYGGILTQAVVLTPRQGFEIFERRVLALQST